MNKVLFLDRDGVINILDEKGYTASPEGFYFVRGIFQLCKKAQEKGFKIIIITNQSGIGRGNYTLEQMQKVHQFMLKEFQKRGISISDVFYTTKDESECRKPNPGMFEYAKQKYGLTKSDMFSSVSIGDKPTDIQAALRAGVGNIYSLQKTRIVKNGKVVSCPIENMKLPQIMTGRTRPKIQEIRHLYTLKNQLQYLK